MPRNQFDLSVVVICRSKLALQSHWETNCCSTFVSVRNNIQENAMGSNGGREVLLGGGTGGGDMGCLPELGYPRLVRSDTKPGKMHCSPIMSLLLSASWIHATTMSAAAAAPDSQPVKHLMRLCAQRASNTEDLFRLAASNEFSEAATVGVQGTSLETEQRLLEEDVTLRR